MPLSRESKKTSYLSIDKLQNVLRDEVFHDRKDAKKAAGRALGTLVEIIAFYLFESWGFRNDIAIERKMPEYGNPDILHNVEFTLHPLLFSCSDNRIPEPKLPLSISKIRNYCPVLSELQRTNSKCLNKRTGNQLLAKNNTLKNACTVLELDDGSFYNVYLQKYSEEESLFSISHLHSHPYAMIECKRVGVEEGMKKGPQSIEKAKQGAYVARTVSSLQKVRDQNGEMLGVRVDSCKKEISCKPYGIFLDETIRSDDPEILNSFTLTVGVVSNHGNWFTSENHNKELKVLAQSYDWLLFLTDDGLAEFISELLLSEKYPPIRNAFLNSYDKTINDKYFTKSKMRLDADMALRKFFRDNKSPIEKWFNVISAEKNFEMLKVELQILKQKNWTKIVRQE